jgi:hypothetical protein
MNYREVDEAVRGVSADERQEALIELSKQVHTLALAVLELAGDRERKTGTDPLGYRSRVNLSEFVDVNGEGSR